MKKYLECSRSPWYSLLFVLPLWLLYEVLAYTMNLGQRAQVVNGADAILRGVLGLAGMHGRLAGMIGLAIIATIWVYRKDAVHRRQGVYPGYFVAMLAESAVYACLFGGVVVRVMQLFIPDFLLRLDAGGERVLGFGMTFMTSLGAGIYEELLFRVLLMGGMAWAGTRFLRLKPGASFGLAVFLSSLLFSAFHYVGSLGDTFRIASFSFRFFAGILLAVLYRYRGFGIAAYTHALYDVLLLLQGVR